MRREILKVEKLHFHYSDMAVLQDVSFSLQEGDFLGIVGENGTGKSTLMKLILNLLPGYMGEIEIFGENRKHLKDTDLIGYVSQKANSFNGDFPATVEEIVSAHLCPRSVLLRKKRTDLQERVDEALCAVGMQDAKKRLIGHLSGGQQQRVFIAAALVSRPKLLLLDEPTVGVDARSTETITKLIRTLNEQGMTILMTNHDTHSLEALANKLLVLSENGTAQLKLLR